LTKKRAKEEGNTPATLLATGVAGVVFFSLGALALAGSLWLISHVTDDKDVTLAAAFVFGLAFLLTIISGIVAALHALELTSPTSAFGLPAGSIRAIIALVLILIFVTMGVYLVEGVFLEPSASPEAQNAATQILAMLGTLVTAVAAFYFGTAAVTTGSNAATAAVASARATTRPSAMTKGSAPVPEGYELVGFVHPHGVETQYYFEYGTDQTYGEKTVPASAGADNLERKVTSAPLRLEEKSHFRIVAFSDTGISYGEDAVVTDPPLEGDSSGAPDDASPADVSVTESGSSEQETGE